MYKMQYFNNLIKLMMKIFVSFLKSLMTIALFYQDMIKDLVLCQILVYIDQKILTDDDEPLEEFQSVGGLNFKVLSFTLISILVVSEIMIYLYVYHTRDRFAKAFGIDNKNYFYKGVIIAFPIISIAMETFLVNTKLALVEYRIKRLLDDESKNTETEDESIKSFLALCHQYNQLMKQIYHLDFMEVEINLIELSMEQEPQAVLQASLFILMLDFKRLEILSDLAFEMDLTLYMILTWTIQVVTMARSCVRGLHRHRFPIGPGMMGTAMQYVSILCLLVPKLAIISVSLLNATYLHPILIIANLAITYFILKGIMRMKINFFDLILFSVVPAYHKLNKDNESEPLTKPKYKKFPNWSLTILIHLMTITLYFAINWVLRQDVFIYKIEKEHNGLNITSFLDDVTSKSEVFTLHWIYLISIYFGSLVAYYLFTVAYYQSCHPWKVGEEKIG